MRRRQVWAAKQVDVRTMVADSYKHDPAAIEAAKRVDAEVLEALTKYNCPKCGKEFKRGLFMHTKHCKG